MYFKALLKRIREPASRYREPTNAAFDVLIGLAWGMRRMQGLNVVHRDLVEPGKNVLLKRDGRGLIQVSLFCTQFGSVLFFAGSFLYQAKLDECTTGMAPRIPVDQGSLMYVSGSACYLIQSLLSLALTVRKHGTEHAPPASPKVWANLSPKASSPSRRGTMVNVHDV